MSALSRRAFFGLAAAAPVAALLPAGPARAVHSGGVAPTALPMVFGAHRPAESFVAVNRLDVLERLRRLRACDFDAIRAAIAARDPVVLHTSSPGADFGAPP